MKRRPIALGLGVAVPLSVGAVASADPHNFPDNPNACVGTSSTTANQAF